MKQQDTWPSAENILEQMDRRTLQATVNKARERYPNQRLVLVVVDTGSDNGAWIRAATGTILSETDQQFAATVRRGAAAAREESKRTSIVRIESACFPLADLRAVFAASGDPFRPLVARLDADDPDDEGDDVTLALFVTGDIAVATAVVPRGTALQRLRPV